MEGFFKSQQAECLDPVRFSTRQAVRTDIVGSIEGLYIRRRLHRAIGYRRPLLAEQQLMAA